MPRPAGADVFHGGRGLKANLDIGDIVGVRGGMRRTDRGELSVTADSLQVHRPAQLHVLIVKQCPHSRAGRRS